jgi:Phytanoyl-CoA dioxygenase (PhyH)
MDNNAESLQKLESDGFFVWRNLLPADQIDRHLDDFMALNASLGVEPGDDFYSYPKEKQAAIKQARYDLHRENTATLRLIFNDELLGFLQEYFGDEPVMRQPETGLYHRKTPDHTDSLDFKVDPHGREVRMWCALEDIHPDSGPVYFVPGSHQTIAATLERDVLTEHPEFTDLLKSQLKATTAQEFYRATQPMWSYVKQRKLPTSIEENGVERQPMILNKGDTIVFSSDTVHGTCHCFNPELTRKYLVAFWSSTPAVWYQSRSYWGPLHDYRQAENSVSAPVQRGPYGSWMSFEELHAAYMASFERAVVQH